MTRVYRDKKQSRLQAVWGLLVSTVTAGAVWTTPGASLVARLVGTLVAVGIFFLAVVRGAGSNLAVDASDVTIRNPLRTYRIPLSRIDGFSVGPTLGPFFWMLRAELPEGRVPVWAIQVPVRFGRVDATKAEATAAELTNLIRELDRR